MVKLSRMSEDREEITRRLLEASGQEKQISCTQCREISLELGVGMDIIGGFCDKLKIRIYACELGCF